MADIYIVMINSDPTVIDSDEDKINDKFDKNPLVLNEYPERFIELINQGAMDMNDMYQTDDGLTLCMTSCYDVYKIIGYPNNSLYTYDMKLDMYPEDANEYYLRDWYFFSVTKESKTAYGLILLSPNRNDSNRPCRVAVPFVELDEIVFTNYDYSLKETIKDRITKVTNCNAESKCSEIIVEYFNKPTAEGGYEIAKQYSKLVINTESVDNKIIAELPGTDASEYRDDVLKRNSNKEKKDGIYDPDENTISIKNPINPSINEIQCILSCRTNNPSMNSFAAEIYYHAIYADLYNDRKYFSSIPEFIIEYSLYQHAVRADLNLELENFPSEAKKYKSYDGKYVVLQRNMFGDK